MRGTFHSLFNFFLSFDSSWDQLVYPIAEEISILEATLDGPAIYQILRVNGDPQSGVSYVVFFGNSEEQDLALIAAALWKKFQELSGFNGYLQQPLLTSNCLKIPGDGTLDFTGGHMYHVSGSDLTFLNQGPLPQSLSWTQEVHEDGMSGHSNIEFDQEGNVQLNGTFTRLSDGTYAVACALKDPDRFTIVFGHGVTAADKTVEGPQINISTKKGFNDRVRQTYRELEFAEPIQRVLNRDSTVWDLAKEVHSKLGGIESPWEPHFEWMLYVIFFTLIRILRTIFAN